MINLRLTNQLYISFIFILFLGTQVQAQVGSWEKKKNMPGKNRSGAIAEYINGNAIIGSGMDSQNNELSDFWKYNPQNDSWTQIAGLDNQDVVSDAGSFVIGDKLYVAGGGLFYSPGHTYLKKLHIYDEPSNTWSRGEDLPKAVSSSNSFSLNGKGYLVGGADDSAIVNSVYEYNPAADEWNLKGGFPDATAEGFAEVVNDTAWVGTGFFNDNKVFTYDPNNDQWTRKNDFPLSRSEYNQSFVIGNYLYVVGGKADVQYYNSCWRLNTKTDTWTEMASYPGKLSFDGVGFSDGTKGYVGIGQDTLNGSIKELYAFTPPAGWIAGEVKAQGALIDSALVEIYKLNISDSSFSLIDSAEISVVDEGYYEFSGVDTGTYYIRAKYAGKQNSGVLATTYYRNAVQWSKADDLVMENTGDQIEADINMAPIQKENGEGRIRGKVIEAGPGKKGPGDPLGGVEILLFDDGQNLRAASSTNEKGEYEFSNISLKKYDITVDIPGVKAEIREVELTEENKEIDSADFEYSENEGIVTSIFYHQLKESQYSLEHYPNPAHNKVFIQLKDAKIQSVEIYSIDGRTIESAPIQENTSNSELSVDHFEKGIYIIQVELHDGSSISFRQMLGL